MQPFIMEPTGYVPIQRMPQQLMAQTSADDWTGLTSSAERRKRQNRLNKRSQCQAPLFPSPFPLSLGSFLPFYSDQRAKVQRQRHRTASSVVPHARNCPPTSPVFPTPSALQSSADESWAAIWLAGLIFEVPGVRERVLALAQDAYLRYIINTPRPTQLPFLITLNINIAMAGNATMIGLSPEQLCREESVSPFNKSGPSPPSVACPQNLQPTLVQREVLHHPWLDVFPFPRFRDNVIRAVDADLMDDDDLCADIAEMNFDGTARPSLIVWGDPCDPSGWEASVLFLRKWGWLLRGCPEVLEATNRWRRTRGENELCWKDAKMFS
jgi:hypothetical protein